MKTSAAATEHPRQPTQPAPAQAFADSRPAVVALQRIQKTAEASPRNQHLVAMRMLMSGSVPAAQRPPPKSDIVVQRVTAQILPDATDGKIGGVAIIGRRILSPAAWAITPPPSP